MSSHKPETEILVHIAAPSRAADDADYRALAAAYLSFAPTTRISVGYVDSNAVLPDGSRPQANASQDPVLAQPLPTQAEEQIPDDTPWVQAGLTRSSGQLRQVSQGDEVLTSPDMSFRGVAHNLGSPTLNDHGLGGGRYESQSSWRAPPSVVEDSNPDNNVSIAKYCSPTRILEHYLQGFDTSQSNGSQPALSEGGIVPSSPLLPRTVQPEPTRTCFQNPGAVIPLTPLPASRGPSEQTEPMRTAGGDFVPSSIVGPKRRAVSSREEEEVASTGMASTSNAASNTPDPTPSCLSTVQVIPSSRADSEPPYRRPHKRQRRIIAADSSNAALSRTASDIGPRQEEIKKAQLDKRQGARQSASGLEVHSPEPPVGCEELTVGNILTPKLEKLARDLNIKKKFQPKEQRREVRPFERGYWHLDCSAWKEELKRDVWAFLTNYVSSGEAGWGIWCRRAEDFGLVRVYCWGCVVGHIYLALYLASRRELNYTGTTWIGGDGEVVIVMAPKYEQRP